MSYDPGPLDLFAEWATGFISPPKDFLMVPIIYLVHHCAGDRVVVGGMPSRNWSSGQGDLPSRAL